MYFRHLLVMSNYYLRTSFLQLQMSEGSAFESIRCIGWDDNVI